MLNLPFSGKTEAMRLVWSNAMLMARPAMPWLPIALLGWLLVSWLQMPAAFTHQATPLFASAAAGGYMLCVVALMFVGVLSQRPIPRVAVHPLWLALAPWVAWLSLSIALLVVTASVTWVLEFASNTYAATYLDQLRRLTACILFLAPVATWIPTLGALSGSGLRVVGVAAILAGHGAFLGFPTGISATTVVALPHWSLWIPASAGGLAISVASSRVGRPQVDRRFTTSTTHVSG